MTDTHKGKVASLTGNLLARKGTATPAGFTRVHPDEIDLPESEARATPDEASQAQPLLNLGGGSSEDKDGRLEESWAPLSQIVIRPHPFASKETVPEPALGTSPAITPINDIGIEPSLLVSPALLLPVTPRESGRSERVTVETPLVPPVLHPNEPILVVPKLRRDGDEDDGDHGPEEVDETEYEELAAPTLGPAIRDWGGDREVQEDAVAAVTARRDPILELPVGPEAEPQLSEPDQMIGPVPDDTTVTQSEEEDRPAPIVLPKPGPVLAPVVAQRTTARPKAVKPIVVPPIRIGELQARARVIPTRGRRRRRIRPLVFAILALAIFLGVTWQAYRTSRDNEGVGSGVAPDGEPTIWATVDELGYAVSQILAAITGRLEPGGEENSRLAAGADNAPPSATFVPAGPVGGAAQTNEPVIADAESPPGDFGGETVTAGAVEGGPDSGPEPAVVGALPASRAPLPAPPVPVPVASEETTVAVAPLRPVGVTAPPPPPLNVDVTADGDGEGPVSAPPQGLEEVDTAVVLEPLAPATVAVAAGVAGDSGGDDGGAAAPGVAEVVALPTGSRGPVAEGAAAVEDRGATAAPASGPDPTEIAALPAELGAVGGLDVIGGERVGVPVLKPIARSPQLSLGGTGDLGTNGPGDAGSNDIDGYAVQLSSLKTRVQAELEHDRLLGDYPALLGEVELVVSEGAVSNRGTFFRILTSRFEDAGAAQALCRSLRDRGQDCLVVRR